MPGSPPRGVRPDPDHGKDLTMADASKTNVRKKERVGWQEAILFRAELESARTLDLSEAGLSITVARPLPLGSDVDLCFFNGSVAIKGKVRNQVMTPDGTYRVGVEFESPQPEMLSFFLKN